MAEAVPILVEPAGLDTDLDPAGLRWFRAADEDGSLSVATSPLLPERPGRIDRKRNPVYRSWT